jgi:hypothetical protein
LEGLVRNGASLAVMAVGLTVIFQSFTDLKSSLQKDRNKMIVKGNRRGGAKQLADHILRRETNEKVIIREIGN